MMNGREPGQVWLLRLQNQCAVPVPSLSGEVLKGPPNPCKKYVQEANCFGRVGR